MLNLLCFILVLLTAAPTVHGQIPAPTVMHNWTWIPKTATPPRGRVYFNWLIAPGTKDIVLAGGTTGRAESPSLWKFQTESQRWLRIQSKGAECVARSRALAWGVIRNGEPAMILFGGYRWGIGMLNDFCSLSLTSYLMEKVPLSVNALSPNGRSNAPTFQINDTTVGFFAGRTVVHISKDIWLYYVNRNQWQVIKSEWAPLPRHSHVAAYHARSNCLYTFSGIPENSNVPYNDFYMFNFTAMNWTLINVTGPGPAPRFGATAVFLGDEFMVAGGNEETFTPFRDVWFYNVVTRSWRTGDPFDIGRNDASAVAVGQRAYVFGGMTNELGLVGDLLVIDGRTRALTVLAYTTSVPSPRAQHVSAVIGADIIIHGGYDGVVLFSDTWAFNAYTSKWRKLEPGGGKGPGVRYAMSAISRGGSMITFGGFDGTLSYNDVWLFVFHVNEWLSPISMGPPTARHRHNGCVWGKQMIIFGGTAGSIQYDELWSYYIETGVWRKWETNQGPKVAHAAAAIVGDILVVSGGYDNAIISDAIWLLSLITGEWTKSGQILPVALRRHAHVAISESLLLVVAGETLFSELNFGATVWSITISSPVTILVEQLDVAPAARSGHTACAIGDTLFVFGGNTPPGWGLRSADLSSNEMITIKNLFRVIPARKCTAGTMISSGGACAMCPAGTTTIDNAWDSVACVKCPAGTFNPNLGGRSARYCIPCVEGTFAPTTGTVRCLSCPPGETCPLGALFSVPSSVQGDIIQAETPISLVESKDTVAGWINTIAGISVCAYIVALLLFLGYLWFSNRMKFVMKFDYLFSHHHRCSKNGYRIQYRTIHGGVFSLITGPLGFLLMVTLLSQLTTNRGQSTFMLPTFLFAMDNPGSVNLRANLVMKGCPLDWGTAPAPCPSYVSVVAKDMTILLGGKAEVSCRGDFTGRTALRECEIEYKCTNCVLIKNIQGPPQFSAVSFTVTHEAINSMQLLWTLAMSSIISKEEVVGTSITPPPGTLFRGLRPATVIEVMSIPSMRYEYDTWDEQTLFGFTSVVQSVTPGSSVTEVTYNSVSGLAFEIRITPTFDTYVDERHNLVPFCYIVILSVMSVGCIYSFSAMCFTHLEFFFVSPKEVRFWNVFAEKDPTAYVSMSIENARAKRDKALNAKKDAENHVDDGHSRDGRSDDDATTHTDYEDVHTPQGRH